MGAGCAVIQRRSLILCTSIRAPNGLALPDGWAGVDSPSKWEKLQATQKPQKRGDSQTSGARLVRRNGYNGTNPPPEKGSGADSPPAQPTPLSTQHRHDEPRAGKLLGDYKAGEETT